MDFVDDPAEMTPEQRLREVAAILALSLTEKRLDVTAAPTPPCAEGVDAPEGGRGMSPEVERRVAQQIEALSDMTVAELRLEYVRVFGEESRSRHKDYLRKRIAWRLQANEEGGLSERALRRAAELATDADLRLLAPAARTITQPFRSKHNRRLPVPGSVITREYKGRTIVVTVLPNGFEYAGTVYRSLTAIAKAVTGSHWNGLHFFGIAQTGARR